MLLVKTGFMIAGTVGIVNLRHVLYGISVSEYLKKLSLKWKIILSYLITDEAFAISYKRFSQKKQTKYMHFHLLGSGITFKKIYSLILLDYEIFIF